MISIKEADCWDIGCNWQSRRGRSRKTNPPSFSVAAMLRQAAPGTTFNATSALYLNSQLQHDMQKVGIQNIKYRNEFWSFPNILQDPSLGSPFPPGLVCAHPLSRPGTLHWFLDGLGLLLPGAHLPTQKPLECSILSLK